MLLLGISLSILGILLELLFYFLLVLVSLLFVSIAGEYLARDWINQTGWRYFDLRIGKEGLKIKVSSRQTVAQRISNFIERIKR